MPKKIKKAKRVKRTKRKLSKTEKKKLKIIEAFTKTLREKFKQYLKAVVVFGSAVTEEYWAGKPKGTSDTDVLVIVDDTTSTVTSKLAARVREAVLKLANDVDKKKILHVQIHFLTEFMDFVWQYDPVAIRILRTGIATYDTGFFIPMKNLLKFGRFKPTRESVEVHAGRSPRALEVAKARVLDSVYYLYLAIMNSAHAALLTVGIATYPEKEYGDLIEHLVKPGLIESEYAETYKRIFELWKKVEHHEVKELEGKEIDELFKDASKFVKRIEKFIGKHRKKWSKEDRKRMKLLFAKEREISTPGEDLLLKEEKKVRRPHL